MESTAVELIEDAIAFVYSIILLKYSTHLTQHFSYTNLSILLSIRDIALRKSTGLSLTPPF